MSLHSNKFSRFPSLECADLECHDSLETGHIDTEMVNDMWKPTDRGFLISIFENDYNVNSYYLESRQPFINNTMRSLLVDWVIEICSDFFLKRETCYKAISYIDRYLSDSSSVKKEHFQLLGLTACFLSAKCEEVCYPKVTDFIKSAGNIYTVNDIKIMERRLLSTLKWRILQPNHLTILDWLTSQWDSYVIFTFGEAGGDVTFKDIKGFKRYREVVQLIDASMLDIGILRFKPRIVAACACYLILFKHFKEQNYTVLAHRKGGFMKEYEDEYVAAFMEVYLSFINASLEVNNFDELYACGLYLSNFVDIPTSYEFPNVCKSGLRPEAHYLEFLSYQTYNPLCIQFVRSRIKSNLN